VFSVMAEDPDHSGGAGDSLTYLFNYGDGQTGSSAKHEYAQSGRYLVSCRVTDENGVSQTGWIFVTVGELQLSPDVPPAVFCQKCPLPR
jgi:hypothetical protein